MLLDEGSTPSISTKSATYENGAVNNEELIVNSFKCNVYSTFVLFTIILVVYMFEFVTKIAINLKYYVKYVIIFNRQNYIIFFFTA